MTKEEKDLRKAFILAHRGCLNRVGIECASSGGECDGCVEKYLELVDDTVSKT